MTSQPSYFALSSKDRIDALEVAASTLGRPADLLEKDIWVVWALDALFSSRIGEHLVFKGGTSLSKAYKAIDRFSEDVDLTYDIRQIIPDLIEDPDNPYPPNRSQAKNGRRPSALASRIGLRQSLSIDYPRRSKRPVLLRRSAKKTASYTWSTKQFAVAAATFARQSSLSSGPAPQASRPNVTRSRAISTMPSQSLEHRPPIRASCVPNEPFGRRPRPSTPTA